MYGGGSLGVQPLKITSDESTKRAARVIVGVKTREEHTVNLFKKLDWIPFYDEININKLRLIFECLNGKCPECLSNQLVRVSDTSASSSQYGHIKDRQRNIKEKQKAEGPFYLVCETVELFTCEY